MAVCLMAASACHTDRRPPQAHTEPTAEETLSLSTGEMAEISALVDSLPARTDMLSPAQTVALLMAILQRHNAAADQNDPQADLQEIRKFVSVYDTAIQSDPPAMSEAFDAAARLNPAVNFDSIASAFRRQLAQYDAIKEAGINHTTQPSP